MDEKENRVASHEEAMRAAKKIKEKYQKVFEKLAKEADIDNWVAEYDDSLLTPNEREVVEKAEKEFEVGECIPWDDLKRKINLPVVIIPMDSEEFVVECPVLPGCVVQGKSREEALIRIKEAAVGFISMRREMGLPDIEEMVEVEVELRNIMMQKDDDKNFWDQVKSVKEFENQLSDEEGRQVNDQTGYLSDNEVVEKYLKDTGSTNTNQNKEGFTRGIELNPNDWSDCEWFYEDEREKADLMRFNEEYIRKVANEKGITLRDAIEYVFNEKFDK